VLGFYSALFFTIAGVYEVPHLRTIFNFAVDYQPSVSSTIAPVHGGGVVTGTVARAVTDLNVELGLTAAAGAIAAARQICYPILKAGTLALLLPTLPSFMRMDPSTPAKYFCFSDFDAPSTTLQDTTSATGTATGLTNAGKEGFRRLLGSIYPDGDGDGSYFSRRRMLHLQDYYPREHNHQQHSLVQYGSPIPSQHHFFHLKAKPTKRPSPSPSSTFKEQSNHNDHRYYQQQVKQPSSLRHRFFQGQMTRPHLLFSLENYPDDARIGPHIIAANFQAFLVCDLILGAMHYRRQLEPFSTVIHHIIYFFIVVHMRAGDMLSVFCILGTPIEGKARQIKEGVKGQG
jgi:hypothetical protein